jgi:hypothetical protein
MTLNKRPRSITVIGWIFLVAGVVGFAYHATEFKIVSPVQYDLVWVSIVRLLAIAGGVFVFRACNWARWLLVVWIAYHVVLSAFHSTFEVVVHGLLLVVITYFLFNSKAAAYFRGAGPG